MEPIDVAKLIGGKVLANFQGNPAFVNGCTVRLSYALNMCGGSHKIPFSYEKQFQEMQIVIIRKNGIIIK